MGFHRRNGSMAPISKGPRAADACSESSVYIHKLSGSESESGSLSIPIPIPIATPTLTHPPPVLFMRHRVRPGPGCAIRASGQPCAPPPEGSQCPGCPRTHSGSNCKVRVCRFFCRSFIDTDSDALIPQNARSFYAFAFPYSEDRWFRQATPSFGRPSQPYRRNPIP